MAKTSQKKSSESQIRMNFLHQVDFTILKARHDYFAVKYAAVTNFLVICFPKDRVFYV